MKTRKLGLSITGISLAAAMLVGVFGSTQASETVNCTESQDECIRITLGSETHIYPGTKAKEDPQIQ